MMDWLTLLSFVAAYLGIILSVAGLNYALLSWLRADMKSFEAEIRSWKDEINKEMRDFHGRMCSLEERRKTDP